jgi:hypothetical protein
MIVLDVEPEVEPKSTRALNELCSQPVLDRRYNDGGETDDRND